MEEKHWSDRGQNAEIFNEEANKQKEFEENRELFREALKPPEAELTLNPPGMNFARNPNQQYGEEEKVNAEQERKIIEDKQREAFMQQQEEEKKQVQQELAEQQENEAEKRAAALRTEAERKREDAQAKLETQEKSMAGEESIASYREQFEQATSQAHNIEVEQEIN